MKDITPEKTPKNAKVERYTNEIDAEKDRTIIDRFFISLDRCNFSWLSKQNWFLWGCVTGAFIAVYRNFDRIMGWFQ